MRPASLVGILICTTVILALVGGPAHARAYTNQADVKVGNAATSDGYIIFKFAPKGGNFEEISVAVEGGWSERRIAQEIQVAFNGHIGANYKVTWNNKRKVTVTKRNNKKRFYLSRSKSTANGVTVTIDYD